LHKPSYQPLHHVQKIVVKKVIDPLQRMPQRSSFLILTVAHTGLFCEQASKQASKGFGLGWIHQSPD
jgi:hypothetical protein